MAPGRTLRSGTAPPDTGRKHHSRTQAASMAGAEQPTGQPPASAAPQPPQARSLSSFQASQAAKAGRFMHEPHTRSMHALTWCWQPTHIPCLGCAGCASRAGSPQEARPPAQAGPSRSCGSSSSSCAPSTCRPARAPQAGPLYEAAGSSQRSTGAGRGQRAAPSCHRAVPSRRSPACAQEAWQAPKAAPCRGHTSGAFG